MSLRIRAQGVITRYGIATVALLHAAFPDVTIKAIERVVSAFLRDNLIRHCATIGRQYVYAPTALVARRAGLDDRRFRRFPGIQALVERLAILSFCVETRYELVTKHEFAQYFPEQAACRGLNHARYCVDFHVGQPVATYLVPDYGADAQRVARKVLHEWNRRKEHQAFRDLIYHKPEPLFRLLIVTEFESKAASIRRHLAGSPFRPDIVVVPGLEDLQLTKGVQPSFRTSRPQFP
jgi:hypothetical protein